MGLLFIQKMKILITDDVVAWINFHTAVMYEIFGEDIIIDTAESATSGYNKVLENNKEPYDIILTDLQMEDDYSPKLAGEWFVEQIKTLPKYFKTKIVIISASYNIRHIAETLNVDCIPKSAARVSIEAYAQVLT